MKRRAAKACPPRNPAQKRNVRYWHLPFGIDLVSTISSDRIDVCTHALRYSARKTRCRRWATGSKIRLISRFCPLGARTARTYTRTSRLRFELHVRKVSTKGEGVKTRSFDRSIVMRIGLWSCLPYPRLHNPSRPVRAIYFSTTNSCVAWRRYDYGSRGSTIPVEAATGSSAGCLGFLGMFGTLGLCSVWCCPFTGRAKIVDPFSLRNDIGFLASSLSLSLFCWITFYVVRPWVTRFQAKYVKVGRDSSDSA